MAIIRRPPLQGGTPIFPLEGRSDPSIPPIRRVDAIPPPIPPARNGLDVQVANQRGQVADFIWPLRAETPFRPLAKVDVEGSNPFSRSEKTATYRAIAGWPFSVSGAFPPLSHHDAPSCRSSRYLASEMTAPTAA